MVRSLFNNNNLSWNFCKMRQLFLLAYIHYILTLHVCGIAFEYNKGKRIQQSKDSMFVGVVVLRYRHWLTECHDSLRYSRRSLTTLIIICDSYLLADLVISFSPSSHILQIGLHVGSRNQDECLLYFLRLPIEEKFNKKDSALTQDVDVIPFGRSCNPVMYTMTFLASVVSPQVAASAAKAAMGTCYHIVI